MTTVKIKNKTKKERTKQMKKILAILLAAMLMLGAVACNSNNTTDTDTNNDVVDTNDIVSDTESNTEAADNSIIEPAVEDNTMGMNIWNLFLKTIGENSDKSCEELGNIFMNTPDVIPYGGMAMPIEEGFLTGFNNYEVKGFKSGAVFMPMIGTIPFVGYVFELEEGADVKAFIKELSDNCFMRWNLCTSAEQVVAGAKDNKVLFVMCPSAVDGSFGEE